MGHVVITCHPPKDITPWRFTSAAQRMTNAYFLSPWVLVLEGYNSLGAVEKEYNGYFIKTGLHAGRTPDRMLNQIF